MATLTLLDLNGDPIVPSDIPPGAYSPDSKKILILGDGYTSSKQSQFLNHVRHLIKTIISTHPFLILKSRTYANYKFLQKIMFFRAAAISSHWGPDIHSTPDPVKYPLTPGHVTKFKMRLDLVKRKILPDLSYGSTGELQMDPTEIINFITALTHHYPFLTDSSGNPLSASDIWLNQNNNSYGLVSLITPYPVDAYIGTAFRPFYVWAPSQDYFPASYSVADMRVPYWPYITLHEIGHAFGLEEEYDFGPDEFPDVRLTPLATGFPPPDMSIVEKTKWISIIQAPNLLFRSQLVDRTSIRNNETSELQVSEIDVNNIKRYKMAWFKNMSGVDKSSINKRHAGYFSYRDFWSIDSSNNVLRGLASRPITSPAFPTSVRPEAFAILKTHPGDPLQYVWRFPYAHSNTSIFLVEGANNNQRNIYRSHMECIMRIPTPVDPHSDNPIHRFPPRFCKVCENYIKNRLKL